MRFSLEQAHIDYFRNKGSIEFEEMFSEKECSLLFAQAEALLIKRTSASDHLPLNHMSNENLFLQGKNLWKDGLDVKKLVAKKQLGEIAYHFFRKKPVKLAYDQYLRTSDLQDSPFKEDAPLSNVSSIRPVLGAAMILLEPLSLSIPSPFLPQKRGSVLFVASNASIPFLELFRGKNLAILLIAFTAEKPIYCLEPRDPHTHDLKKEGLVFGDNAGEDLCPTLYYP